MDEDEVDRLLSDFGLDDEADGAGWSLPVSPVIEEGWDDYD